MSFRKIYLFLYSDFINLFIITIISFLGLFLVFSATTNNNFCYSIFFKKQLFGIILAIIIYFIFSIIDYRDIERYGYFLYIFTILLLIFTILKGSIGMGAKRWINLIFFKFQPSELAKLFFPPFFSYYISNEKHLSIGIKNLYPILIILFISFILILKQPDLGTALIILFSSGFLLWLFGIKTRYFIIFLSLISLISPIIYKSLKPYQRKRIEVFMGFGDSKIERYQIEQSRIAVGSGGLLGKGYLKGTQNKLHFLPESRTDFIFAVLAEEFGFLGAFLLIILYLILFTRVTFLINSINNFFIKILASGLIIHIILAVFVNISMVLGLLPIVGIPLPFVSYGISNLVINFASFGFLNSIYIAKKLKILN